MDNRVIDNHELIIQATSIIVKGGCYPARIVIQEMTHQFAVHMEILRGAPLSLDKGGTGIAFRHHLFSNGSYFYYNNSNKDQALKLARENLNERWDLLCKG